MVFSSTITGSIPNIHDGKLITYGTFTNTAVTTGGNIDAGMKNVDQIFLQYKASSVVADAVVVNETLPIAGSAITIATTAGGDGYWLAFGRN